MCSRRRTSQLKVWSVTSGPGWPISASTKKLQNLTRHAPAKCRTHIRTCMFGEKKKSRSPTFNWPAGAALQSAEMSGRVQRWKSARTLPVFSLVVSLPLNLAPLKSSTSRLGLNIWKMFRICRALCALSEPLDSRRETPAAPRPPQKDTYGSSDGEEGGFIQWEITTEDAESAHGYKQIKAQTVSPEGMVMCSE